MPASRDKEKKLICLQQYLDEVVTSPFLDEGVDTSKEEGFVYDLLWEETDQGFDRLTINNLLAKTFDTMQTPFMRTRVFANGRAKKTFFIAKGTHKQMVALTFEQADAALELATNKLKEADESIEDFDTIRAEEPKSRNPVLDNRTDSDVDSSDDDSDGIDPISLLSKKLKIGQQQSVDEDSSTGSNNRANDTQEKTEVFSIYQDQKGNPASRNLHVSGYGPETTKRDIWKLFTPFVKVIEVVPRGAIGYSYSYMFVNTAKKNDAVLARTKLNGKFFNGGLLKINFAR
jgi:hypothetical protein